MRNSLERILIIFRKEVVDNLRDRRSIFSALMSSLIGPALIVAMIVIVGKAFFTELNENGFYLPVVGAANAPNLVRFLEQNGAEIQPPPADPESEVRNGTLEVVLVISEDYAEDFTSGYPATLRLIMDSSRQSAMATVERTKSLLQAYNNQLGALRLMARGISPSVITPLTVERDDVATPQSQVLIFLNMMPYFVILVVFVGGMYVIIDTTAGERERGSLEPLLINPAARWEFVMGKLLAAVPFAIFAVFITLIAFAIAFNAFPLEEYVGFQLTIDIGALWGIFLIAIPMVLLASALQMVVATFTRSFKEAQTYVAFLPLIPALPGIGLAFLPIKASIGAMLIPTFGQQLIINQLMRGETLNGLHVAISTLVTLLAAGILTFMAIKLYEREQTIFGVK
jgi:sodium transport system permease protein